jgi:hypothetical protein
MKREFIPKLVSGVGRWELFSGTFIIGNAELDRYIRVPAESVEPVWRAIQYCDGIRTLDEIGHLVQADGWNFEVASLYQKLVDAGLVAGTSYNSDLDRVSVTWFELGIRDLFPNSHWWRRVAYLAAATIFLSFAATAGMWLAAPRNAPGVWNPAKGELVAAMISGAMVSVFVHEGGHALIACAEGLRPKSVRLLGYLGVIPYIMLRIPGLYTIRPSARLRVWLAGPLASLGLASFCYLGSGLTVLPLAARAWMDRMSLVNGMIAVWNCCPLLPTDGYFVACTLLKQANWRIRSWRELVRCVRERRSPQMLLLLYGIVSSIALVLLALRSVARILKATNFSWFGYAAALLLILMFVLKRAALSRHRAPAFIGGM